MTKKVKIIRRIVFVAACVLLIHAIAAAQTVKHVVLISIDGFHPDMYLDKSWPTPNLRWLMQQGTYADHMKTVFPSFTYPSHTAMISGAMPARSKILYNQPINNKGDWYWYYNAIKTPTLWTALKDAGYTTANIMWPVTVGAPIDYSISEIWNNDKPEDRITVARQYTNPPGLVDEFERNATGKLDSTNFNESHFSMDENCGRMAAYLIEKYKPGLLALHVISCDENEHDYGRDADSVRLAVAVNDRVIGSVLEAIKKAGIQDSTAVLIVGDHGFATINQVFRPNILIKSLPVRFVPAGGSAFLYRIKAASPQPPAPSGSPNGGGKEAAVRLKEELVKAVSDSLNTLPADKRKLFRIIDRKELDRMGADSAALMALTAEPGLVFSGSTEPAKPVNKGAGTFIQQSPFDGMFFPTHGGHHGYDPNIPEMWTGFIAYGTGIRKGAAIQEITEPDIAALIAKLLGIDFKCPDGKLVEGILK